MWCSLWLLIAGSMLIPATYGQWLPVSAKQRQNVYNVSADGTETLSTEVLGTLVRSSNGSSLLINQEYVNGVPRGNPQIVLRDTKFGRVYQLDYERRRAIIVRELSLPVLPKTRGILLPNAVVHGVPCTEVTVSRTEARTKTEGRNCISEADDLTLRSDFLISGARGCIRFVQEFYDVEVGIEPDPAIFAVPAKFQIVQSLH